MDDFERRRELRRQKREEMRLEAERLSYQRNDDDDEEAARERRRRARQERLRQKEEGDLSGEATEKSEVNAQNSVAGEESKRSTDDEAALLERLARREERRQKRLQEALERQKELDPTITDGSLSVPSRREVNNVEENETTGKEEKAETRRGRCEIEETETVTKSYQRNNWRQDGEEEGKKEEKDKEEEKPKEETIEENQVDVTAEKSTDKEEGVTVNAEEHKAENDTNAVPEGTQSVTDAVDKEKLRDEEKAEEERKEAEERERLKAEEEKRAAEEKQRAEEEKRAAEERAKAEEEKRAAEERERAKAEEERRAAEERERAKAEEERRAAEEKQKAEEERRAAEERAKAEEEKRAAEEKARLEAEKLKEKQKMEEQKIEDEKRQAAVSKKQEEEKVEAKKEKLPEEKLQATSIQDQDDKGKAPKEEMKSVWDRKKGVPEQKAQNGEREPPASKLKRTENAFGRSGAKGAAEEEAKPGVEALKRLEDQRRRRGESESEELEKLKEKQQEAAAELDELKKRREERRKILEEEEQKKKQEEAERKIREEEEKRRMKEEIERRRAEAAEKRQKMPEEGVSEDKKPFKCLSPKGSSLKIEERTEFLNKSAQKSGMKPTQTTAVVSKIDSRLEQYTSAIGGTKASRPKASDLHVPAEGVRNIKSMWEKGNVFSSPSGTGTPNKETAGLKVGVSSRINEWLTKTPEGNKSPAPKPSDLRPGDVSGKRNLWEKQSVEKPGAASKVSATGKKSETNGLRQFEKEP
ncbi:caldesmon isoform X2 [Molothrus aeneus]|uniref:caldesmon isoform X2 n=1 Tax=Molothrus ater TaxID=84834 RepID=UPI00174C5812|nr:caldesmon isoform X2 [Molothrus ater]